MITDQEYAWQDLELAAIDLQLGRFDRLEGSAVGSWIRNLTGVFYNSMPKAFCKRCGVEGVTDTQECEKCLWVRLETEHYI